MPMSMHLINILYVVLCLILITPFLITFFWLQSYSLYIIVQG